MATIPSMRLKKQRKFFGEQVMRGRQLKYATSGQISVYYDFKKPMVHIDGHNLNAATVMATY